MAAADIHQSMNRNMNVNNNNCNAGNAGTTPSGDVASFVARLVSLNPQQLHCLHSDAHLMRQLGETQLLMESRLEALNKFAMSGHHPAANQQLMLLAQHASHQHQLQQQQQQAAAAAAAIAIANQNNTLVNYADYHQQLHNQQQQHHNLIQHHQQPYFTHYVQLPLGIAVQTGGAEHQTTISPTSSFRSSNTTSADHINHQNNNTNLQHHQNHHLGHYALDLSSPGAQSTSQHDSPSLYANTSSGNRNNNNNNNKKPRINGKRSTSKKSSEQQQNNDEQLSNASSDQDDLDEEFEVGSIGSKADTSSDANNRRRSAKRLTSTSSSTSSTPSTSSTLSLTPPQQHQQHHHHNANMNSDINFSSTPSDNNHLQQHHHHQQQHHATTVSSILQNNIINNTISTLMNNANTSTNLMANTISNANNTNSGSMLISNNNLNNKTTNNNVKRYKGEFDEPTDSEIEQRLRDLSRGKENYHQVNWLSGECACVLGSKFPGSKTPGDVLSQIEAWRRLDTNERLAFKWSLDDLPQDIRLADIKRLEDLRRDASNGRADFGGASKRKPLGIRGTRQFLLILYCLWGHPGRQDAMQKEGYCPHCFAKIRKANDQSTLVRVVNHFNMKHRKGANPRLSPSA